jgi:hypothetical protein
MNRGRESSRPLHKIIAMLDPGAWHGHASETMWAEKLGEGRYRLRNVPFYARGLSVEDIVTTQVDGAVEVIREVSIHGGHSTYRIFLSPGVAVGSQEFLDQWKGLAQMRCTFERASARLLAVDVPPTADLQRAYDLLLEGEKASVWDFEEGSVPPHEGQ